LLSEFNKIIYLWWNIRS